MTVPFVTVIAKVVLWWKVRFKLSKKEVKSMTEIINILKDELKYNCAYKEDCKLSSTYAEKLKSSSIQCRKCLQLASQLQVVLNELSSVKLITDILSEECKSLKQTSHVDPNVDNLWSSVKPYNSSGPTATRPPELMQSSLGASNFCKYTVPTSNWYAVLSNHLELQQHKDSMFSSDFGQPSRRLTNISNNHSKRLHRKKSLSTTQIKRSTPYLLDNHNLQESRKNEDETSPIPTIVNGAIYVNSNLKHSRKLVI